MIGTFVVIKAVEGMLCSCSWVREAEITHVQQLENGWKLGATRMTADLWEDTEERTQPSGEAQEDHLRGLALALDVQQWEGFHKEDTALPFLSSKDFGSESSFCIASHQSKDAVKSGKGLCSHSSEILWGTTWRVDVSRMIAPGVLR